MNPHFIKEPPFLYLSTCKQIVILFKTECCILKFVLKLMERRIIMSDKSQTCENCGSPNIVTIIYGNPSPQLMEEYKQGKVQLGGCDIAPWNPKWHCKNCLHEWGSSFLIDER